ncbi:unnamed protein product [Meganyctiphanes norvegica]|uniref:Calpain catalytic domain-containing protein n=1 Tax=Meganyctiphanes norvegica TaxID=48144 RepID=A0AAV2QAL5_MEGNR
MADVTKPTKEKCLYDDKGCDVEHHEHVVVPAVKLKDVTVEDFERLRKECLEEGRLYEDPDYPAENSSLYYSDKFLDDLSLGRIEWRRPKELCDDPKLFSEGHDRFDVVQGQLGNCWFPAALAPLTLDSKVLHGVAPKGQSFDEKYAGIFHFRFWQYGRWVTVIIDDRLPTSYGDLVFMTSRQKNEFWSALLEKAYAKLHGSYQAIEGGWAGAGLEDFTGGLMEEFPINNLRDKPIKLFNKLLQAQKRGSLMGCSLDKVDGKAESLAGEGIVYEHAYSITSVKYIKAETPEGEKKMRMIRVRNPWGQCEWSGPWSDYSSEWEKVPNEVKEKIGHKEKDDGEYWMEIKDFCKHFDVIEITHLNPANDKDYLTNHNWEMTQFDGTWKKGISAGGCTNFSDTFHTNPQYRLTLHEHDDAVEGHEDDDEDNEVDGHKCTVIVSLMQKNRRSLQKFGKEFLSVGFSIFKISDPENAPKCLDQTFFVENEEVTYAPYKYIRTSTLRFQLAPGSYCVVPTTFEPDNEGDFLIRIFSEKHHASDIDTKEGC